MGLFAPVAAYLGARLGTRRAMTIALALIGLFGVLRAIAPSAWLVVLLTWPVGIGMGLGNALSPLVVRETVPDRPATGTGVYTTGIQLGSTVAAALAVPLAAVLGGWRGALIAFSLGACVVAVAWVVLGRGGAPHERPARLVPRLPWRSRTAWLLAAIFGSMASAYYGLNAWLPDAYGERGWSDESAGILLAGMNLTAIPASFLVPWLSDRHGGTAALARRDEPRLRDRRRRPRRAPRRGLPVGAPRRDLAGRHVRARDDAAARPRGAAASASPLSSG